MTTEATPGALGSNDQLGLDAERDVVLAQLDDATNQTWRCKRALWAALVRKQSAEVDRLRAELQAKDARIAGILAGNREREACLRSYVR